MANRTIPTATEERGKPLGDTGDGETGVPADEQGISNRPGDAAQGSDPDDDDDEDDDDVDDVEGDDDDDLEGEEDDEVTDPRAEPGKPI